MAGDWQYCRVSEHLCVGCREAVVGIFVAFRIWGLKNKKNPYTCRCCCSFFHLFHISETANAKMKIICYRAGTSAQETCMYVSKSVPFHSPLPTLFLPPRRNLQKRMVCINQNNDGKLDSFSFLPVLFLKQDFIFCSRFPILL